MPSYIWVLGKKKICYLSTCVFSWSNRDVTIKILRLCQFGPKLVKCQRSFSGEMKNVREKAYRHLVTSEIRLKTELRSVYNSILWSSQVNNRTLKQYFCPKPWTIITDLIPAVKRTWPYWMFNQQKRDPQVDKTRFTT